MTIPTRLNQLPLLVRLCLFVAVVLVLIGCGSSADTAATTAALQAATPTPIPTTAPLSLPAADDTLPALAPVTASVASAPATEAAAAPATEAAAAPAAAPSTAQDAAVLSLTSAARWSDCVVQAAQATGATAVLDPIASGTAADLSSVQLNALAAASVTCDMVTTGLVATDVGDYLPTATSCVNAWLESSGGGSVFVGLASIGWGQPTPTWAQTHTIDALASCFTGGSFAADVMSVVAEDPSLSGAFDASCLATSFDSSGTMGAYAQALVTNPATAELSVGLGDTWVLNCANVGQMVAAAAAADGVALSASTISCIDSELKSSGVVAHLLAGTADTDAVGIATIACLTNAEASALLG